MQKSAIRNSCNMTGFSLAILTNVICGVSGLELMPRINRTWCIKRHTAWLEHINAVLER